ncbi:CPBP family intramembrane glutamic endopeptidase [Alteromonas antoniana]|uniref:CPBP family intramembrane glutamic endopeptidase n=1 Tax=Alteromonas antoniana TaxID=2803813 RepID=UPI001C458E05|nr:CPBP family intramembrane glutamic endopeptidase [Alteromonas antoniana]
MIGLILIAISWGLLRVQGRSLSVLGFNRPAQRLIELIAGFVLASLFASAQFLLISKFSEFEWLPNPDFRAAMAFDSLRWIINSVLYEELIFRGYLLYKAMELIGTRKACFLSAIAFGAYHWFSNEVFGSLVPMVYVFLLTSSFGFMLACSFSMTKSLVLPVALHLGWNTVTILVFSNGPLGSQMFLPSTTDTVLMSTSQQIFTSFAVPLGLVILVLWVVTHRVHRDWQLTQCHSGTDA